MASPKKPNKKWSVLSSEKAMIEGILEGSPDGIGVVVIRLDCGCRKMAAVSKDGEPASKVIMYRDQALSICEKCRQDNGAYVRISESFIHWLHPEPAPAIRKMIETKALGSRTN